MLKGKQRRIFEKYPQYRRRKRGRWDDGERKKKGIFHILQSAIFLARESPSEKGSEKKVPLSRRVDAKLMSGINSRCVFINQNRDRVKNPYTRIYIYMRVFHAADAVRTRNKQRDKHYDGCRSPGLHPLLMPTPYTYNVGARIYARGAPCLAENL